MALRGNWRQRANLGNHPTSLGLRGWMEVNSRGPRSCALRGQGGFRTYLGWCWWNVRMVMERERCMASRIRIWPRRVVRGCHSNPMGEANEFNSVLPSHCFLPSSEDTWLKEEAILISISVTPNLSLMNPDVNYLIRTPRSTQRKFSFRCMTLGYLSLRFFFPWFYLKDKTLPPVIRCASTWSFQVWSADKSFSAMQSEGRASEVLA